MVEVKITFIIIYKISYDTIWRYQINVRKCYDDMIWYIIPITLAKVHSKLPSYLLFVIRKRKSWSAGAIVTGSDRAASGLCCETSPNRLATVAQSAILSSVWASSDHTLGPNLLRETHISRTRLFTVKLLPQHVTFNSHPELSLFFSRLGERASPRKQPVRKEVR